MKNKVYLCTGLKPECMQSKHNICFRNPINERKQSAEICKYTSDLTYALCTAMKAHGLNLDSYMVPVDGNPELLKETIIQQDAEC